MIKILIADDNKQITSILEEYSKSEGYTPIIAFDGLDAITKFNNEQPDVVLLDVMMPKKDGFTLAKEIRNINQEIPIIFLILSWLFF